MTAEYKHTHRINYVLIAIVVLLTIMLLIDKCSTQPEPVVTQHEVVIDSVKDDIKARDSLIIIRDSVEKQIHEVTHIITEIRFETDTIYKLRLCDSLVVACDSLAHQYGKQDSIFREQIQDYELLTSHQDSLITDQKKEIKKLKRKNVIAWSVSGILAAFAIVK